MLKVKNNNHLFIILFLLVMLMTTSVSVALAGPTISWKYFNETETKYTECPKDGCWKRNLIGICIKGCMRTPYEVVKTSWDNYKDITKESMSYLSGEISTSRFRQCVKKGSVVAFGPTNPSNFNLAMRDVESLGNVSRWPEINFQAGWYKSQDNRSVAGSAYVERVAESTSSGGLRWSKSIGMTIYLGWLKDWFREAGRERTVKELAGVILHEFLHQMGHSHQVRSPSP